MAEHHPPSGGGSKLGNAWGLAILAIVVIMSGAIAMLGSQLGAFFQALTASLANFLQVMKMNAGPLLGLVALILIFLAMKKSKE